MFTHKEKNIKRRPSLWLLVLIPVLCFSCNGEETEGGDVVSNEFITGFASPVKTSFRLGEKIPVTVSIKDPSKLEEISISLDGKTLLQSKEQKASFSLELVADSIGIGQHVIGVDSKVKDSETGEHPSLTLFILSDTEPAVYTYKVVKKYTHDTKAYTQGLFMENGNMYEGTGQKGESQLRQWDFKQNKVLQSASLEPSFFGEGIAPYKDRIYQLTWQNHVCLVYDKNSFKPLQRFNLATEGWGLTFDGTHLVLSDGTQYLYYYDPETFTVARKIQVGDNTGLMNRLNELEYINGEIWANVYMTDWVVVIDPASGKITRRIDFSNLLSPQDEMQNDVDVLNGIAYDAATGKIYVTGKLWPWMFEVEVMEKAKS